tara:strand:- start:43032 stop:43589 length:558 start_codon:yes stop_codon:yes gene_type:complete
MKEKKTVNIKSNKSSTYLLPFVDVQVKFEFLHLLKNSYLSLEGEDEVFCVLYEWSSDPKFTKYEGELMNHILFEGHEDYGKLSVYKFRLTRNMQDARKLFINGKYSMFVDEHKDAIESFLVKRGYSNVDRIKSILNRGKDLREELNKNLSVNIDPNNELSSPPDMSLETFMNHVIIVEPKIGDFK